MARTIIFCVLFISVSLAVPSAGADDDDPLPSLVASLDKIFPTAPRPDKTLAPQAEIRDLRTTVDPTEAQELFDLLAGKKRIPFEFVDDGCYARAHAMSRILTRRGYYNEKVFIEGPDLRAKRTNGSEVHWSYHVAPVIFVRQTPDGMVKAMVLDPALSDRPLLQSEWAARISRTPCFQRTPDQTSECRYYRTTRYTYWPPANLNELPEDWRAGEVFDASVTNFTFGLQAATHPRIYGSSDFAK